MRPFEETLEAERILGDEQNERALAAASAESPRASPGPMQHDVYRISDSGLLKLIVEAVTVQARGMAGRREAVRKATEQLPEDEQYGTFVTVKHGEMSAPITREKKLEPTDVWS